LGKEEEWVGREKRDGRGKRRKLGGKLAGFWRVVDRASLRKFW
jgi:hypothetical protein